MSTAPWRRISKLLKRLYRDQENGLLMGVCAGIADYFEWPVIAVRVAAVALLFFWLVPMLVVYITAGLLLKDRPLRYRGGTDELNFWRREGRQAGGR
ncbi:MAG: PspC domain-containing protein [Gammaproteobacteria bacterium]|nr:PspC domain-containing protein [Gammaproteobacteria bacterium]